MNKRKLAMAITLALGLGFTEIIQANEQINSQLVEEQINFPIRNIEFEGNNSISSSELKILTAPFIGEKKSIKEILEIRDIVIKEYEKKGYSFISVGIPKEVNLDGTVSFYVFENKINTITIKGNKFYSDKQIRQSLPELKEGTSPNFKILSRQLFLANDNPNRNIILDFKANNEIENKQKNVDVIINVEDKKIIQTGITIDNSGNKETGDYRTKFFIYDSSLNDRGDMLALSYTTSSDSNKVSQTGLYYQLPLIKNGDKIDFFMSKSNVNSGRIFDMFNVSGQGDNMGIHYSHYLYRSLSTKETLDFGIEKHQYKNTIDYLGMNLGVDVDASPYSITYSYSKQLQPINYSFDMSFIQNMPGGYKNNDTIYNQNRLGAKANFSIFKINSNYQITNKKGWTLNLIGEAQYSNDALIAGEQFKLGGMNSVRGYKESEFSGDSGIRFTTEIYSPIRNNQRYLFFIDQARYWRNNAQVGEKSAANLCSIGIGWRQTSKKIVNKIDLGFPLIKSDQNIKINVSSTYLF